MKKTKRPGDNISLKTKKTEDPAVMQWINAQTNLMDSLRYLIEHEIVRSGVRNLQAYIPVERNTLVGIGGMPGSSGEMPPQNGGMTARLPAESMPAAEPGVHSAYAAAGGVAHEEAAAASEPAQLGQSEAQGVGTSTEGDGAVSGQPSSGSKPNSATAAAEERIHEDDDIDDDDIEAWV